MDVSYINKNGLVLLGCGKMGSAMLQGWLSNGVTASAVTILDPRPSGWVQALCGDGVNLNSDLPQNPAICILAIKPQMMQEILPTLKGVANGKTVFLSIAAGISIKSLEKILGEKNPIIRAMPNMPAAIGKGISALIGNAAVTRENLDMADALLQAVGQTIRLDHEDQMDAVTALSGSGPAYVFHLIESLANAGRAEGLPKDMAMLLAKATVGGAAALAEQAAEDVEQLRINVTSPGGTTAAALEVLMDEKTGFQDLLKRAVKAAADRSRELSL